MIQGRVKGERVHAFDRGKEISAKLAGALAEAGWRVAPEGKVSGDERPDLVASKKGVKLAVELKVMAEGRADRLIPLWSQAWLQIQNLAHEGRIPMAVVGADRVAPKAADAVLAFIQQVAPRASAGVMDLHGLRRFVGPFSEGLNADASPPARRLKRPQEVRANLFSDLNQWMLKVLLAPDIPERYLSAPRDRCHGASDLGSAAGVSIMSASRLIQELRKEGFLDESVPNLRLVRVRELLERWKAAVASQPVVEQPWRSVLLRRPSDAIEDWLSQADGCIALFAAAKAHGLGFVEGVPAYLYARRSYPAPAKANSGFVPAEPGEAPNFIVRKPSAPKSIFRGVVHVDGRPVCDILQVWLDIGAHPSRGREQAEFIWSRVLEPICSNEGR